MKDWYSQCSSVERLTRIYRIRPSTNYGIALLLYVARKLNETLPFSSQMAQRIWSMQAYNGGIITNYVGTNMPLGVVNTYLEMLVVLTVVILGVNVSLLILVRRRTR
jgi:hypothetical protein